MKKTAPPRVADVVAVPILAAPPHPSWPAPGPSVLVMSHSHPRLTHGGAEIAAHNLFKSLRAHGNAAWFIGGAGPGAEARTGAPFTQPYGPEEYVYHPGAAFDYFKFANPDPKYPGAFETLLAELAPEVVHLHHYVRFGVETFSLIRRTLPLSKIVLTLHEFLAICNNNGQMVRPGDLRLCQAESVESCASCFPHLGARDFFLRKRYLKHFLAEVDLFISPSRFLASRYIAWGLPAEKIEVLENLPPAEEALTQRIPQKFPRRLGHAAEPRRIRIGFFGQMSPLKGIGVLVQAAQRLKKRGCDNLTIDIFGDHSNQPLEYQEEVKKYLAGLGDNIVYHGPYEHAQVRALMSSMDAVVVPSVWWENSPLVIQEAFSAGRPVIASDLGGMTEKIRDGVDGLLFEAGNAADLADLLADLAAEPERLEVLAGAVRTPVSPEAALGDHLRAYARLFPEEARRRVVR